MDFFGARVYLDSFINYEKSGIPKDPVFFKLKRMQVLLQALENPQNSFRSIHIAGTKGKGSTAVFVCNILSSAGLRCGLYSSPHLFDFRERIRVMEPGNNCDEMFPGMISEEEFCDLCRRKKPVIDAFRNTDQGRRLSYFEVLTALAFCFFLDKGVDYAVIEAGIGGRLDATNTVNSQVGVLTSIGLEHTRQLGSTLEAIAWEKAAIIKDGAQIAVIALQHQEAMDVIKKRIKKIGCASIFVGKDVRFEVRQMNEEKMKCVISGDALGSFEVESRFVGRFQALNIATAVGVIESLKRQGLSISVSDIRSGIEKTQWPGRFEIRQCKKTVVFDCAHTAESMQALRENVQEIFKDRLIIVVAGFSRDKNIEGMLKEIKEMASLIILTTSNHPRAYPWTQQGSPIDVDTGKVIFSPGIGEALEQALAEHDSKAVIVVTGSLFLVAEAKEKLCRCMI